MLGLNPFRVSKQGLSPTVLKAGPKPILDFRAGRIERGRATLAARRQPTFERDLCCAAALNAHLASFYHRLPVCVLICALICVFTCALITLIWRHAIIECGGVGSGKSIRLQGFLERQEDK